MTLLKTLGGAVFALAALASIDAMAFQAPIQRRIP
jgi:hypothetical protein